MVVISNAWACISRLAIHGQLGSSTPNVANCVSTFLEALESRFHVLVVRIALPCTDKVAGGVHMLAPPAARGEHQAMPTPQFGRTRFSDIGDHRFMYLAACALDGSKFIFLPLPLPTHRRLPKGLLTAAEICRGGCVCISGQIRRVRASHVRLLTRRRLMRRRPAGRSPSFFFRWP